jgi:protein-disulfide isomerase
VADAEASGARGTPTFFVGNRRHQGPYDARTLIAELEAAQDGPPTDPTAPRMPPESV